MGSRVRARGPSGGRAAPISKERMTSTDIILDSNDIALGAGWGKLESFRGESFRWVANDPVVHIATVKRVDHQVSIHLEPGPGVGLKRFTLKVLDAQGEKVGELDVKGRQTLGFLLPADSPRVHALHLHVDEGGQTSPNDPRVLNFRVFKIAVTRLPSDVVVPGSGYRLGSGWYPLERFNNESFRWVNNDAVVQATSEAKKPLQLEVEAGPGLDFKPFVLTALDQRGGKIASVQIRGRELIEIPLPEGVVLPTTLRLHVDGGGKTSSNDNRIMNFRVFEANPADFAGAPPRSKDDDAAAPAEEKPAAAAEVPA
jgi:hypothetical protein